MLLEVQNLKRVWCYKNVSHLLVPHKTEVEIYLAMFTDLLLAVGCVLVVLFYMRSVFLLPEDAILLLPNRPFRDEL